jgi:hypothetical protein
LWVDVDDDEDVELIDGDETSLFLLLFSLLLFVEFGLLLSKLAL